MPTAYLVPVANGVVNEHLQGPVPGGDNYEFVDDPVGSPDDLGSFLYSNGPTTRDELFTMAALPAASAVSGVTTHIRVHGNVGQTVGILVRSGGTTYEVGTIDVTRSLWENWPLSVDTDPDTGVVWTPAGLAAAQFGFWTWLRSPVTQFYLEVAYALAGPPRDSTVRTELESASTIVASMERDSAVRETVAGKSTVVEQIERESRVTTEIASTSTIGGG